MDGVLPHADGARGVTALLVLWAACAAGFSLVAWVRLGRPRRPAPAGAPPVLLVRPADALTHTERACLAAPIDYAPLEHVVLAPAAPGAAGVAWEASDPATANRKVGHLLNALRTRRGRADVVLCIDTDVRVDGTLVAALAAAVADGAALATAPPRPLGGAGLAARAVRGLLTATHHDFRALDAMRAGASAACGKAMALGPAALALLPEVADRIGEDLELSRRLHAARERVVLVDAPARMPLPARVTAAAAAARFTRWLRVLRAHRPGLWATVPALLAPTPPLVAAALGLGSAPLLAAAGGLVAARTLLARRLSPEAGAIDWLLGETLLLAAFLHSVPTRTVAWRGRVFRIARGGRMRPEAA
jgi:hypothetical protein